MPFFSPEQLRVLHPTAIHTHTVIWLHPVQHWSIKGPSFIEHSFIEHFLSNQMSERHDRVTLLELLPSFRWVFPDAADRGRSLRYPTFCPNWLTVTIESKEDLREEEEQYIYDMMSSLEMVTKIIEFEIEKLGSADRLILGGQGMGATIAVLVALCRGKKLGGLIALLGWLPLRDTVRPISSPKRAEKAEVDWTEHRRKSWWGIPKACLERLRLPGEKPFHEFRSVDEVLSMSKTPVFIAAYEDKLPERHMGSELRYVLRPVYDDISFNTYKIQREKEAAEHRMICDVGDWLHDFILMKVKFPIYVGVSGDGRRLIDPKEIFVIDNNGKRARSKRQTSIDKDAALEAKGNW